MELNIEQMVTTVTGALGLKEFTGLIVTVIAIFYIVLDRIYKYKYSVFYKIPGKYFKLNNFKDIFVNCVIALLAIYALSYIFSECFYGCVYGYFYISLVIQAAIIFCLLYYVKQLYLVKKQNVVLDDMSELKLKKLIQYLLIYLLVPIVILIFLFACVFNKINLQIQCLLIVVVIIMSVLEVIFIAFKNNKIIHYISKIYQIIYFTIVSLTFFALLSSLLFSDKITGDLANASKAYHESKNAKMTTVIKDCNKNNEICLGKVDKKETDIYTNLSKHISEEIRDSNNWSYAKWVEKFNDPELIINTYKCECLASAFIKNLEKANMKEAFLSTMRLLLMLNLMNNYIFILIVTFACMCIIIIFGIFTKNSYFDPSSKKNYEYIVGQNNEHEFIISEYKDKMLVLCGDENNNILTLKQDSYRLVSQDKIEKIYLKEFDKATTYK